MGMKTGNIPKVALVGLGHEGRKYLQALQLLDADGQLKLVGLSDVVQRDFTVKMPFYLDYSGMLQKVQPDVVIVTAPNCFHPQLTVEAMEASADVIKAPPVALTVASAQLMAAVSYQTHQQVVTLQPFQAAYLWQIAKEKITSFSPPCDFHYCWYLDRFDYAGQWRPDHEGSLWQNIGWQMLSRLEWLLGTIKKVQLQPSSLGARQLRAGGSRLLRGKRPDMCFGGSEITASVELVNGGRGQISLSCFKAHRESLEMSFENNWLYMTPDELVVCVDDQQNQWYSPDSPADCYYLQLQRTLSDLQLRHGTLQSDLRLLKMMEGCQ